MLLEFCKRFNLIFCFIAFLSFFSKKTFRFFLLLNFSPNLFLKIFIGSPPPHFKGFFGVFLGFFLL